MRRRVVTFFVLLASLSTCLAASGYSIGGSVRRTNGGAARPAARSVDQVIEWNRTLLEIVRTPGAQPPTIHPTRSFAIMHAAIFDAVNAIDRTYKPYLVDLEAPRN